MKFGDSKAIKSGQWFPNEIFLNDDINFVGESTYQNLTDHLGLLADEQIEDGKDVVMGGLQLIHSTVLTTNLKTGGLISSQGAYLNSDVWGFIADPGDLFGVFAPVDQTVVFDSGGANDRIDTVEVRPTQASYNSQSRSFKDPITGLLSSSTVSTRIEYGIEVAVRKGDDTTALTNEQTTFTVNSATVGSDIAGKYILFSTIYDDYYVWYNTGASSDPAVIGRTGIEITIGAADDKDAIGAATRAGITVSGITVSGALAQIILTGTTYTDLIDATNGDMTTYFDSISITQGNGAAVRTSGWVKVAEVLVIASASSIDQDDIKDWRDSDQWENYVLSTVEYVDGSVAAAMAAAMTLRAVTIEEAVSVGDVIVTDFGRTKYEKADTSWVAEKGTKTGVSDVDVSNVMWEPKYCQLNETDTFWVYYDSNTTNSYGRIVRTNTDGSLTLGTPQIIIGIQLLFCDVCALTDELVIVVHGNSSVKTLAMTISGLTVSAPGAQSAQMNETLNTVSHSQICRKNDTHFVWNGLGGDFNIQVVTCSVSGTTISIEGASGIELLVGTYGEQFLASLHDDVIALVAHETSDVYLTLRTYYVTDGGTWNLRGTHRQELIETSTAVDVFGADTIMEGHIIVFWGHSGQAPSYVTVFALPAPVGSTANEDSPMFPLWTEIGPERKVLNETRIFDIAQGFYAIGKDLFTGSLDYYTPIRIHICAVNKGTVGMVPCRIEASSATSDARNHLQLLAKDRGVLFWIDSSDDEMDIQAVELYPKVVGFATSSVGASEVLTVQHRGLMGGFSGLVAERDYWLHDDGTIKPTVGLVKVGKAFSTTELFIDIKDPW